MKTVREIVIKKMRAKYPGHALSKAAVDTAAGILLVQGMQALYMPADSHYPGLVFHQCAAAEVMMFWYLGFSYHTISDEAREKYACLVHENVDSLEIAEVIAEDICKYVFQYYPNVKSVEDAAEISPMLHRRIKEDAIDILMKIHFLESKSKQ